MVLDGTNNPEKLEALAVRGALSLTGDLLVRRVEIASDCLRVINALHDGLANDYVQTMEENKARLKDLVAVSFCHESRNSNKEARDLARYALRSIVGWHIWLMNPP